MNFSACDLLLIHLLSFTTVRSLKNITSTMSFGPIVDRKSRATRLAWLKRDFIAPPASMAISASRSRRASST